ncbi:MAG: patatin-like phospholipase family protein [Candidatus Omnitrophica bacterium]|nr:patatin-like phospholipase family protein [Candidatus Omnitrophota bacterium]
MNFISQELIISEIPLFAGLSEQEKQIIKERSEIVDYNKGQVIYEEGSGPSALYCLVLGRVVIYAQGISEHKKVLEYLHRGKYFGMISLLTNEPHSVTAQAINDTVLLIIKKEDFDFILKKIPRLAIDLSQTLSRRLKRKDLHQKTIFESTIASVFSSYSQAGKTVYSLNLALSIKKETSKSVIILDILPKENIHTLPDKLEVKDYPVFDLSSGTADNMSALRSFIFNNKFGIDVICFYYDPEDESCVKKVVAVLSLLVNDYNYLILDLPSVMDRPIFSILNQSDIIHILSSPDEIDLKKTHNLIARLKDEFDFNLDKIKIIINEYKLSKLSYDEETDMLGRGVYATLPKIDFQSVDRLVLDSPDSEYAKAVRRIARQIGDCQLGLVFGVGVAYGFCHIGVLKVIEEENIPIDIIAGSSMGALIASLWAIGRSSSEILEMTKEFKEPKHIWGLIDLTWPFTGFIKGNKLHNFLKKYLGNKTFYDLKLPLKIIASDVRRKEPRILDKGLLADAIMASCAMPGVFAPFKFKEEFLYDGGVIYPLPTEALFKLGVKKIIAVNVTPSREDIMRQYEKIKEDVEGKPVLNIKKKFQMNMVDAIFSTVEILQSEVAQKEGQLADIILHPDTSGLYWLELHKAAEFARRGELEARKNLDKIKQIVNE